MQVEISNLFDSFIRNISAFKEKELIKEMCKISSVIKDQFDELNDEQSRVVYIKSQDSYKKIQTLKPSPETERALELMATIVNLSAKHFSPMQSESTQPFMEKFSTQVLYRFNQVGESNPRLKPSELIRGYSAEYLQGEVNKVMHIKNKRLPLDPLCYAFYSGDHQSDAVYLLRHSVTFPCFDQQFHLSMSYMEVKKNVTYMDSVNIKFDSASSQWSCDRHALVTQTLQELIMSIAKKVGPGMNFIRAGEIEEVRAGIKRIAEQPLKNKSPTKKAKMEIKKDSVQ